MIQFINVSKAYKEHNVIENINLCKSFSDGQPAHPFPGFKQYARCLIPSRQSTLLLRVQLIANMIRITAKAGRK